MDDDKRDRISAVLVDEPCRAWDAAVAAGASSVELREKVDRRRRMLEAGDDPAAG